MRYIRTKDELGIEREDGTCYFRTWAANSNSPLKKDWLYANTIEELCDELVIVFKDKRHWLVCDYETEWESVKEKTECIYGAIWTDKGLIYVAKMNEKGELELI